MIRGRCKLCRKRRQLVRSHLMPAALYAMRREHGASSTWEEAAKRSSDKVAKWDDLAKNQKVVPGRRD